MLSFRIGLTLLNVPSCILLTFTYNDVDGLIILRRSTIVNLYSNSRHILHNNNNNNNNNNDDDDDNSYCRCMWCTQVRALQEWWAVK